MENLNLRQLATALYNLRELIEITAHLCDEEVKLIYALEKRVSERLKILTVQELKKIKKEASTKLQRAINFYEVMTEEKKNPIPDDGQIKPELAALQEVADCKHAFHSEIRLAAQIAYDQLSKLASLTIEVNESELSN